MLPEDVISEAESSPAGLPSASLLDLLAYQEIPYAIEDIGEEHSVFRASVLQLLFQRHMQKSLSLADRPLIRFLLEQEIACYANDFITADDNLHLAGFLLFILGQTDDVELLWRAKTANFDAESSFDIQCLIGAGVGRTMAYVQSIQAEWAEKARAYIELCRQAGDFDDMEDYRVDRQRYFASGLSTNT
jgi:hypothetical protein